MLMGAVGAIANCIIVEGGFVVPRKVQKDPAKVVLDFGWIGTVILGATAAAATYLLGTADLGAARMLGISLVVGVGGGNVLTSLSQKQQSEILRIQVDALQASLKRSLGVK
jgi:hypothetical protein